MADALGLGPSARKGVEVQLLSRAPETEYPEMPKVTDSRCLGATRFREARRNWGYAELTLCLVEIASVVAAARFLVDGQRVLARASAAIMGMLR